MEAARVNTTKTAERVRAEPKLAGEEGKVVKDPHRIARLKVDLAELKLAKERLGNNDPQLPRFWTQVRTRADSLVGAHFFWIWS